MRKHLLCLRPCSYILVHIRTESKANIKKSRRKSVSFGVVGVRLYDKTANIDDGDTVDLGSIKLNDSVGTPSPAKPPLPTPASELATVAAPDPQQGEAVDNG